MYNAFISYSHAADGQLAPAIQSALEKFAKPWYKIRALNIFRDESSLAATPKLWENIKTALDNSEYLIYMASPESASSKWVNKEIEFWLEYKDINSILIVLTRGSINWNLAQNNDKSLDNSLPDVLLKNLNHEPFYIDLRHASNKDSIDLKNSLFKKEILKLAAQLHGKPPKDLASEEVKVHRRMRQMQNVVISVISALVILAFVQMQSASKRKDAALLHFQAKEMESKDPTVALRLIEEALLLQDNAEFKNSLFSLINNFSFYKVILSNKAPIRDFEVSKNGDTIFTCDNTGKVKIWQNNGQLIKEFIAHNKELSSIAISPNGKYIVTGSQDNSLKLWNTNGDLLKHFQGHSSGVTTVNFSPNGEQILSGSDDNTLILWNLDGSVIQSFKGHNSFVQSAVFSPNGDKILSGAWDKKALLWDLRGNILTEFKNQYDKVNDVAFSPDGKLVLVGSEDNIARLYDLQGQLLSEFIGHLDEIKTVAFSKDGKFVITGAYDYTVKQWFLDGTFWNEFLGTKGAVNEVLYIPQQNKILSAGQDGLLRAWLLEDIEITEFDSNTISATSMKLDMESKHVIFGQHNGNISLYDDTGYKNNEFSVDSTAIQSIDSNSSMNLILSSSRNSATLFNMEGEKIAQLKGHQSLITDVEISKNGQLLLTGSKDGTVILWNRNGNEMLKFHQSEAEVSALAFGENNELIVVGYSDQTIFSWDLYGNKTNQFKGLQKSITSVKIISNDQYVLASSEDETARLWSINGQKITEFKGHVDHVKFVTISSNGKYILTASKDNEIILWARNGKIISRYVSLWDIQDIEFTDDGKGFYIGTSHGLFKRKINWIDDFEMIEIEPLSIKQQKLYGLK